jgi:hypothetical protein
MKNSVIRVSGGIGSLAAFMISDEGGGGIKGRNITGGRFIFHQ